MPNEFEVSTDRVGQVDINGARHMSITGEDLAGQPFVIDAIRPVRDDPDSSFARILYQPADGPLVSEDIKIRNKIIAAKDVTFEFVQHNKSKAAVIGAMAVTVAAGTGLVVRSLWRKHK